MDWSTVILSAGISALVAALMSVAMVKTLTVRQAQAERADRAGQELRRIVGEMQLDLRRNRKGRRSLGPRSPD